MFPFIKIDNTVLSNIDSIEKIFDNGVSGLCLSGKSMQLNCQLAEVLIAEFLSATLVELKSEKISYKFESVSSGVHVENHEFLQTSHFVF